MFNLPPSRSTILRARVPGGFSLVELMVAMAVSILIVTMLVTLVVNNSRAHAELNRSSRQIENGRYAMELLSEEFKLAGFYAELSRQGAVGALPDPCATDIGLQGFSAAPLQIPVAVQGHLGTGADPAPDCVNDHRPETGVAIVRRLSTQVTAADAVVASNAYLQTSRCINDPANVPFILGNQTAQFTQRALDCAAITTVRRYMSRVYYVANCDDCQRDTIPTLKRIDYIDGALVTTPLAEGVEQIQFEYGFDTDGNGTPDVFRQTLDGVAASPANDWGNVMAVRIWMISRATETTPGYKDTKTYDLGSFGIQGPYNDGFKRRAYSQLVRLINPAGFRE